MHVIGTAGHVDHGKSTLVLALTGMDPDRLTEEKARQMTIDLGFAWLRLGQDEVGVVDVPGHRDFIENMLAGVGGIDLALFVVAADEGVMPQTREHLAILDLLQVKQGVVALTKSDLIDGEDWLELVMLEVGETLGGTALANAPIIPVSARTGAGMTQLKETLAAALSATEESPDLGRPRLPIDRVFSLPGFGTVVTGTLLDGSFRIGDDVTILPEGLTGRIRGLQTHKTKRERAVPGSRVAINLSGVNRDELRRGQVVVSPGHLRPTSIVDVQYRHLPDAAAPLKHNTEVKLFIGAAEVTARTRVIGRDVIAPGTAGWLQLALSSPVAVERGDRFILRRPSPGATLGGGQILDPHPGRRHRRLRLDTVERFQSMAEGTPEDRLLRTLARSGPVMPGELVREAGLGDTGGLEALAQLVADGQIVEAGKYVLTAAAWRELRERTLVGLRNYHREAPLRPGIDREELRSRLNIGSAVFGALREALVSSSEVSETGTLLCLPDHTVHFSPEQDAAVARLLAQFEKSDVNSPSVKEAKALVGEAVYFALVDQGRVRPIAEDVVYSQPTYDRLIRLLDEHLREHGSITAAEARDLLGTSRKYAIALLEHLDELRVTRRRGDVRELARPLVPRS